TVSAMAIGANFSSKDIDIVKPHDYGCDCSRYHSAPVVKITNGLCQNPPAGTGSTTSNVPVICKAATTQAPYLGARPILYATSGKSLSITMAPIAPAVSASLYPSLSARSRRTTPGSRRATNTGARASVSTCSMPSNSKLCTGLVTRGRSGTSSKERPPLAPAVAATAATAAPLLGSSCARLRG
ncbi:hypothetical protein Vafri_7362, partial [Volvox africanus]